MILYSLLLFVVGPQLFVHSANPRNINGAATSVFDSSVNGQPGKILIVTQNWNPVSSAGVYNNSPIAVNFVSTGWQILNTKGTPMPNGASFNIAVFTADRHHFVHTTKKSNLDDTSTWFDNPDLNGHPEANILVTNRAVGLTADTEGNVDNDVSSTQGIVNDAEPGVVYEKGHWGIRNLNGQPLKLGCAFNVVIEPGSRFSASRANTKASVSQTDNQSRNSNFVFTAQWREGGNGSPHGVFWNGTAQSIFTEDKSAVGEYLTYNIYQPQVEALTQPTVSATDLVLRPDRNSVISTTNSSVTHDGIQIAANEAAVTVTYTRFEGGKWKVCAQQSSDNGATISGAQVISQSAENCTEPSISESGAGVLLAWKQEHSVGFAISIESGARFFAPTLIPCNVTPTNVRAVATGPGTGYIAWTEGETVKFFRLSPADPNHSLVRPISANIATVTTHAVSAPVIVAAGDRVLLGVETNAPTNHIVTFCGSNDGGTTWTVNSDRNSFQIRSDIHFALSGNNILAEYMVQQATDIGIKLELGTFDPVTFAQSHVSPVYANGVEIAGGGMFGYLPEPGSTRTDLCASIALEGTRYVCCWVQPKMDISRVVRENFMMSRDGWAVPGYRLTQGGRQIVRDVPGIIRTRVVFHGEHPYGPVAVFGYELNSGRISLGGAAGGECKNFELAVGNLMMYTVWLQKSGDVYVPAMSRLAGS